jgi:hypothetical protein
MDSHSTQTTSTSKENWYKLTQKSIECTKKGKRKSFAFFFLPLTSLPVYRTHDDVNTAENCHDIGNFDTPQDMGQDLQVDKISGTNLPTPREDIIIPNDENS